MKLFPHVSLKSGQNQGVFPTYAYTVSEWVKRLLKMSCHVERNAFHVANFDLLVEQFHKPIPKMRER